MENLGKLKQRFLLDSEWCVLLREMVPFVRGPGSQARPSSSFWFYSHTLAGDSRCPVPCLPSLVPLGLWFTAWPTEMCSESGLCLARSYLPQGARPSGRSMLFVECMGCLLKAVCSGHTHTYTHAPSTLSLSVLICPAQVSFFCLLCVLILTCFIRRSSICARQALHNALCQLSHWCPIDTLCSWW